MNAHEELTSLSYQIEDAAMRVRLCLRSGDEKNARAWADKCRELSEKMAWRWHRMTACAR